MVLDQNFNPTNDDGKGSEKTYSKENTRFKTQRIFRAGQEGMGTRIESGRTWVSELITIVCEHQDTPVSLSGPLSFKSVKLFLLALLFLSFSEAEVLSDLVLLFLLSFAFLSPSDKRKSWLALLKVSLPSCTIELFDFL